MYAARLGPHLIVCLPLGFSLPNAEPPIAQHYCREGLGGSGRPVLILILLAHRHKMATLMSKWKKWKYLSKFFEMVLPSSGLMLEAVLIMQ